MRVILLLIFVFTVKGDSDESKYVDLLPDEEKEEFLQRVARRINENVETKALSNKSSVEIPEDQLKEHESVVKKILNEETSNIHTNGMEKEKDTEEYVRVRSMENLKVLESDKHHDDRKSSEKSVEIITENVIFKKYATEDAMKIKSVETPNSKHYSQSSKEDIQVRHIKTRVTDNVKIKTNNFGTEYIEENIKINDAVRNNDTNYADSPKEINIKTIKRRAIENNSNETSGTNEIKANHSNRNESESMSISEEHPPTVMEDFDTKKGENSGEESENEATEAGDSKNISEVTTVLAETQQTNTLTQNIIFTQGIYDSGFESDRDLSNETVHDKTGEPPISNQTVSEASTLSNISDIKETTVKMYLRSNDIEIRTSTTNVINIGNSMETTDKSSETITDQLVDVTGSSSTNDESTDNIVATTVGLSTDQNQSEGIEMTEPSILIDRKIEAGKLILPSDTGDSNNNVAVKIIQINSNITTESRDETNITLTTDTNLENIIDTPTEQAVPTNTVLRTGSYTTDKNKDQDNKRLKNFDVIARIRFDILNDTNIDRSKGINKDVIQTADENESKYETIAMNIPCLTADNSYLKHTTTESIKTTTITENPTKSISARVENQNAAQNHGITTQNKYTTKAQDTEQKIISNRDKPSLVGKPALDLLKDSLLLFNKDKKKEKDIHQGLQKENYRQYLNTRNGYHVYEIPAGEPPFIKKSLAMTDQPYYVPVYNYSPNKAYFITQNRFGPNPDDEEVDSMETKLNTDQADANEPENAAHKSSEEFDILKAQLNFDNDYYFNDGNTQRKKFGNKGVYTKNADKMPQQVKWPPNIYRMSEPVFKETKYNPNDYADIDYDNRISVNIGRGSRDKKSIFPDTDDESHPFNSIKNRNLKDHIRGVRNVLYEKQMFSDPYRTTEKEIETTTEPEAENVTDSSYYWRNGEKSGAIAHDYYFGRIKPEHGNVGHYKKVGYFKNDSRTRNLYMNNDFINDDIISNIDMIKYKDDTYIANGYSATPHTEIMEDKNINQQEKSKTNKESDQMNIISVKDETDVNSMFGMLQEFNVALNQQDDNMSVYLTVLKDIIKMESNALKQYDWLGTTVDLQSAFEKLFGLIEGIHTSQDLNPSDLELLKYVMFLHKISQELVLTKDLADELRNHQLLPRNKNKKRQKNIWKGKGLYDRVWLYRRKQPSRNKENSTLKNLNTFLMELQDALYDLHGAIKSIAKITTYKKQNWFKNIKELYLTDDKSYLTLLLHISATRLFGLVEDSASKDLERDFRSYVRKNRKETMRTVEEMLFVFRILNDIKKH